MHSLKLSESKHIHSHKHAWHKSNTWMWIEVEYMLLVSVYILSRTQCLPSLFAHLLYWLLYIVFHSNTNHITIMYSVLYSYIKYEKSAKASDSFRILVYFVQCTYYTTSRLSKLIINHYNQYNIQSLFNIFTFFGSFQMDVSISIFHILILATFTPEVRLSRRNFLTETYKFKCICK